MTPPLSLSYLTPHPGNPPMKRISSALNEKDVENIYRAALVRELNRNYKEVEITSPHGVDGLVKFGAAKKRKIHVLLEFKFDEKYKSKLAQANVLAQCLYYLKKFHDAGDRVPHAIFVGDINECFVIGSEVFRKYLFRQDIDWSIAPSQAYKNTDLVKELVEDNDINPFVFDVNESFKLSQVVERFKGLGDEGEKIRVKITPKNIERAFTYFSENVLTEKKDKLTPNERANLFVQLVTNGAENYPHPKKRNTLITKGFGEVRVSTHQYRSFFEYFESEAYSPREKEALTSCVDRIVEDATRRWKGEFFTPTDFVDLAHKYISDEFGSDWKERFVVWDCCCGTMNLTRDYQFKELYCSTLEESDLETAEQHGYNPEATKFQYDFLNDDEDKLPAGLREAIDSGKEILFLINPPYFKPNSRSGVEGSGAGACATRVGDTMKRRKMGISSSQLSTQFMYRILEISRKNKNVKLAIFNKPNYLTSGGFKVFREEFLKSFGFASGFLFQASHFADVAPTWAISFAIFGGEYVSGDRGEFTLDTVGAGEDLELVRTGTKTLYNCDNKTKANIIFADAPRNDTPMPPMTSAVKVKDVDKLGYSGAIGYINNHSNNQMHQDLVFLASSVIAANGNKAITPENFKKVMPLFVARRSVPANWMNDKDEYLAPNEDHPDYEQFYHDSIVYSLFNNSSEQSSLRQIDYKDKKWDIKNEFFWMSKDTMLELAEEYHYDEIYQDAKFADERYVHILLLRLYDKLSPDAREVLNMATNLMKKSFCVRKIVSEEHPEYHLDAWDAGYAQLKRVWKDYFPDDFKAFRDKYNALGERMRPLVYELGFLLK